MKKKTNYNTRFSKKYMYSVDEGARYIRYTDGSRSFFSGALKTTGYIPNTKANRDKLTTMLGRPSREGKRTFWG